MGSPNAVSFTDLAKVLPSKALFRLSALAFDETDNSRARELWRFPNDDLYPLEDDIAMKVSNLLTNYEENTTKKYSARLLLEEKFNKEKNFQEYISTIESFKKV